MAFVKDRNRLAKVLQKSKIFGGQMPLFLDNFFFIYRYSIEVDEVQIYTQHLGLACGFFQLDVGLHLGCSWAVLRSL
jgi:hypothetical protein